MPDHPNHSNLTYPTSAPVFEDGDYMATIIGAAQTAAEAMELYATHFAGTGAKVVKALKACLDRKGEGPVDGWVPELADE